MNRAMGLVTGLLVSGGLVAGADAALVAHYTLDNLDSAATTGSGLKNLGTQGTGLDLSVSTLGTDATPSVVSGFIGGGVGTGAIEFDGVDDGLWTPTWSAGASEQTALSAPRTLSAWVNGTGGVAVGLTSYFSSDRYEGIALSDSAGEIRRRNGSGTNYSLVHDTAYADQWQHVLGVFLTGTDLDGYSVELYVNGKFAGTTTFEKGPVTPTRVTVGNQYRSSGQLGPFSGAVDDVGIFSGALTASDVALIHGLGQTGRLGLEWFEDAQTLAAATVGTTALIDGTSWQRVSGLSGETGDWGGSVAGGDAFIVIDSEGNGIQVVPEPSALGGVALAMGAFVLRRRRRTATC